MTRLNRRSFIKASAAVAAAAPLSTWARVDGANDDVRVAVAGHRQQGSRHIGWFDNMPGCRVVALCDADSAVLERDKARFFTKKKRKVKTYHDYRKLMEDDEVDVVVIASTNHWHALMTIWACQAGKDVKVEKPVSHNIFEGRQMVAAARKYDRIVQAGSESRSDEALQKVFKELQDGRLGRILWARGLCYKRRGSIGKVSGPQKPPATVDYDLWTGPAPLKPLTRRRLHYDWHWVWDTGNGDIGNQGAHEMDMCRWALGEDKVAPRVISVGGRFGYDDDGETANTQIAFYDYERAPLIFEVRGLPMKSGMKAMDHYRGSRIGVVIQCEGGYFAGGAGGGSLYDNDGKPIQKYSSRGGGGHSANFIKAVRSRKNTDLVADIPIGHVSAALCHMGNISLRTGQTASPDEVKERLSGEAEATEAMGRMTEHLAANGIDLTKTPMTQGPWLTIDPDEERFTGAFAKEANTLRTRQYRAPFVVPEKV